MRKVTKLLIKDELGELLEYSSGLKTEYDESTKTLNFSSPEGGAVELTEEHLTGETYNGKPVYEKIFRLSSPIAANSNTWVTISVGESNFDNIITCNLRVSSTKAVFTASALCQTNNLQIMQHRNSTINNIDMVHLKYTKTTD